MQRLTKKIQFDIANGIFREPYSESSEFIIKMINRIQRKYKVKVDLDILGDLINKYKNIYSVTKNNLSKYTIHSKTGFADPECVNRKELKKFLVKKFLSEEAKILDSCISWAVDHEYLR